MTELEELLTHSLHEINDLRRRNELLSAKVEMIELFACVLHTQPAARSGGMAPDIAWALQKKLDALKEEASKVP